MKRQQGMTLISLIFIGFLLFIVVVIGMKVAPEYIEYYGILENVNRVAADPGLRDADARAVRNAYSKFAEINHSKSVTPQDLVVAKEGGVWHISFNYSKTIPLVANVSLLLDFEGNSSAR
jgi:hypothetical protein